MRVPRAAAPADSAGARPSVMLGTAAQVRVPLAARAREQVPPPPVPSLGDWLLDDAEEAGLGMLLAAIHNRSISREGRGLAREEHDREAFSRPSGAIFSLPFCCCGLLLGSLFFAVHPAACTRF